MEFVGINTTHDELTEAIRGLYGKDILKDCSFAYCGQLIIGIGENTTILDNNVKCKHTEWINIGEKCWLAILK